MPAVPIESPRVSTSISGTKPSIAKNAADARKAAADAAGSPRRAVSVPGGVILRSAGIVTAVPTTTSGMLHSERSVSPASSAPAPSIRTSDAATGSFDRSSLTLTLRSDGITIAAASTISGSGARNAHRQPTVSASTAPTGGPSSPGRIHIEASRAITLGRIRSG